MNSLKSKLVDDDPTLVLDFLSLPIQIQSYLELGVQYGRTLGRVATRVSKAVGVDITYEKLNTEYGGFVFDDKGNVIKAKHFVYDQQGKVTLGGVSPCNNVTLHELSTDDFFKQNKETFDLIFIDASHEYEQVKKDLHNSLNILNEDGFIALHDVDPLEQRLTNEESCSDTFKITKYIYDNLKDYQYTVYHYDKAGVGVLQKKLDQQQLIH